MTVLSGTTIIAVRASQEIILAADTKIVAVGGGPANLGPCHKIFQAGNLHCAAAGLLSDAQGKFNVAASAWLAADGTTTSLEAVGRFENIVRAPLRGAIREIQLNQPREFPEFVEGKNVLEVAIASFSGGIPAMYVVTFEFLANDLRIQRFDYDKDRLGYVVLGSRREIDKYLEQNPVGIFSNGWRPSIEKLIQLEATAHPEKVAFPVDILRIAANGTQWL